MSRLALVALVVLAVLAACGGGEPEPPITWMAAGDSFSSAEGIPDPVGECARTAGAYAPLARPAIEEAVGVATFAHVACTRARIADIDRQWQEAGGGRFDLVTLTIGGNDAGFGDLLRDCLGQDDLTDLLTAPLEPTLIECDATIGVMLGRIDTIAGPLDALLTKLEADVLTERGRVVVVGYPQLFADPAVWADGRRERCEGFTADAVETARLGGDRLNRVLADVVARHVRATFLDVADLVAGHELCSEEPWLHGINLGLRNGTGRWQSSFHLDAIGHRVVADALADVVIRQP